MGSGSSTHGADHMTRASRFEGTIGRSVADSEAWFDDPPHPGRRSPQRGDRVLLDDTGLRPVRLLRLRHRHARTSMRSRRRAAVHQLPRHAAVLADARRAAHRALPHSGRHARRVELPHRLPDHSATSRTTRPPSPRCCTTRGTPRSAWASGTSRPHGQCSAAGPFDQWPLQRGFDRFYGFLEGETDQFHPNLVLRQPPHRTAGHRRRGLPRQRRHRRPADEDDQRQQGCAARPPFFAYVPFGATHAPHQAPESTSHKYRGKYDEGWDVVRQRWYERQIELGVIHAGDRTRAPQPRCRRLGRHAREPAEARVRGSRKRSLRSSTTPTTRSVDWSKACARWANSTTPSFVVLADNGASQEGGPFGVMHEMKFFNGILETPDEAIDQLDDIGGPTATPTTRGAGPSAGTRRSSGTSRTPTRVGSTCR